MTSQHEQDIESTEAEMPRHDDIADDELLDDDLADDDADDELLDDDVIAAEVTDADPGEAGPAASSPGRPIAMPGAVPADTADTTDTDAADTEPGRSDESAVPAAAAAEPAANGAGGESAPFSAERLSQEWHEIQASFVDDPRGAVQLAAEAADSALTALVTALRERHATLGPSATQDTEQLRAALQEYRRFCQGLAETGRRFAIG
jgi:hypothetical protein